MDHHAEYRRCLLEADVPGMMRIWKHTNPNHPQPSPSDALLQLHIARAEAKSIPKKAKMYSFDLLYDYGFKKINGEWVQGEPPVFTGEGAPSVASLSVGIASKSSYKEVRERIMAAMKDAYLNEVAKGITDPVIQRGKMLQARAKQRFKMRMD